MHCTESNSKILIVDDDRNLRRTMSLILRHRGYITETVENGAEAIDCVREQSFDIILMDIRMPVLNGVQALKEIKAIRPETVVFMMTAYAVEDMIQDALQQGASGVLYKPIEVEQVITLVETAIKVQ
jgi:DNA-binding NtrC family response regulator